MISRGDFISLAKRKREKSSQKFPATVEELDIGKVLVSVSNVLSS